MPLQLHAYISVSWSSSGVVCVAISYLFGVGTHLKSSDSAALLLAALATSRSTDATGTAIGHLEGGGSLQTGARQCVLTRGSMF